MVLSKLAPLQLVHMNHSFYPHVHPKVKVRGGEKREGGGVGGGGKGREREREREKRVCVRGFQREDKAWARGGGGGGSSGGGERERRLGRREGGCVRENQHEDKGCGHLPLTLAAVWCAFARTHVCVCVARSGFRV
jgi:hypothetical protein